MTQSSPRQDFVRDTESSGVRHDALDLIRSSSETISDNDANEKPVREKLKKTSIASISQHPSGPQEEVFKDSSSGGAVVASDQRQSLSESINLNTVLDPSRGRLIKKRSFDDIETTKADLNAPEDNRDRNENLNGHARKRSRDIRTSELSKDDRQLRRVDITVEEDLVDVAHQGLWPEPLRNNVDEQGAINPSSTGVTHPTEFEQSSDHHDADKKIAYVALETHKGCAEQGIQNLSASPRKKRSRGGFDTEIDREQKIPATEVARAHRRSDELERTETTPSNMQDALPPENSMPPGESSSSTTEDIISIIGESEITSDVRSSSHKGIEVPLPSVENAGSLSHPKSSTNAQSQTSSTAFATSGFAAHSNSTTSPFGTLSASFTNTATTSPFGSPTMISGTGRQSPGGAVGLKIEPNQNGSSYMFAKTSMLDPVPAGPSPFSSATNGIFGGSVFGSGFGIGIGGGNRLTNFAAPTGDTNFGSPNGMPKPVGSPRREGDEDTDSEDEDVGSGENENESGNNVEGYFQRQDVGTGEDDETTIFSSRASLYAFKQKTWKEGGKGIFKFNIKPISEDGTKNTHSTGRFIMRAHQTFRVLLNSPVLKKMTIGDGRGNEPSGKSFSFGVVEDGTLVPHLLKLSDTAESKTLYREVKRLQESMPQN